MNRRNIMTKKNTKGENKTVSWREGGERGGRGGREKREGGREKRDGEGRGGEGRKREGKAEIRFL